MRGVHEHHTFQRVTVTQGVTPLAETADNGNLTLRVNEQYLEVNLDTLVAVGRRGVENEVGGGYKPSYVVAIRLQDGDRDLDV